MKDDIPKEVAKQLKMLQQVWAQKYLSDEGFTKHFLDAKDFAKKTFEEKSEVTMMFIAHLYHPDTDEWTMAPIMFADWPPPGGRKYDAMFGLGAEIADRFPDHMMMAVVQVSEAWMVQYPKDTTDMRDGPYLPEGTPMPSEHPDRIEALIIDGCTMDQRKSFCSIQIKRDENEKFTGWGEETQKLYDPEKSEPLEGMTNFLTMQMFRGNLGAKAQKRGEAA